MAQKSKEAEADKAEMNEFKRMIREAFKEE